MGFFFSVRGRSPVERGFRAIGMVLVVLVVIWAFWKNNENMIQKMHVSQRFWDETKQASPHIKSFAREFADSFEEEFGIKAKVQVLEGEVDTALPGEGELVLSISPSRKRVALRVNPEGEEELELIKTIEQGHFDPHWEEGGWEAGLESALVLIWNHYSRQRVGFMEAVTSDAAAQYTDVIDETGTLTPEDFAFIDRFAAGLEREFGQQAVVRVFKGAVVMSEMDNRTLFVGVSPESREAIVVFPPLIRRSLPAGFERSIATGHFAPYFESGDWQLGLKTALIKIWKALAGEDME